MSINVSDAIQAKSDQLNAADLVGGPVVVEICSVRSSTGQADREKQPYEVVISGGLKPWRPCKTMLRLLSFLWGTDATQWVGRWIRIYNDPDVTWAGEKIGGVRIDGADVPKQLSITLQTGRSKHTTFVVEPITPPTLPTLETILSAAGLTVADLDADRAIRGKPPITDDEKPGITGYLRRNPDKLKAIKRQA